MAGIDAPEVRVISSSSSSRLFIHPLLIYFIQAAHFGKPAQPFAEDALAWLKGKVEGKTVYCQLISRDQYSRVVSL